MSKIEEKLVKFSIEVPESVRERLKLFAFLEKTSMKKIIVDALVLYEAHGKDIQKGLRGEIAKLRHQLYRLKYDKEEKVLPDD